MGFLFRQLGRESWLKWGPKIEKLGSPNVLIFGLVEDMGIIYNMQLQNFDTLAFSGQDLRSNFGRFFRFY